MIVLLDNVLQAYDDPVLLFFHYMMYVSHQIETFQLLSTKDTTIQEYLTSLSVSGDYLAGKFGPRDFRYIVWRGRRFGPAFGANNEKLQDYTKADNSYDDERSVSPHDPLDKKFSVINSTRPSSMFGLPSLAQKTESISSCSSTLSDGGSDRNIVPVLNVSPIEKERFLDVWDVLNEAKAHFKLPHEIGVDPVRRLIRILRSALKHLPKLDAEERLKDPYWICDYFLLTEDQEKNVKHLLDRLRKERIAPPLVAIATLLAEYQQDIVELKASRFLKDSIPVSEFARYCVLVRHSIFSAKAGSRKDLILFWDEVWKEWLNSSDEERSKKMLGCAGVHRSWADDDEMRLFVASSEGSEEEDCFADDSFARSVTGGSQDGGLELIKESESEDTFVDGIDMTTTSSKIKRFNYVDEPILSDSPPPLDTGSTESFSRDIFDNSTTEVRQEAIAPSIGHTINDNLLSALDEEEPLSGNDNLACEEAIFTAKKEEVHPEIVVLNQNSKDSTEDKHQVECIDIPDANVVDDDLPVAESTPILEQGPADDHETEIEHDSFDQHIEMRHTSHKAEDGKQNSNAPKELGFEVDDIESTRCDSSHEEGVEEITDSTILHTVVPQQNLEATSSIEISESENEESEGLNETTQLGEGIDETIQHNSVSSDSPEEQHSFRSSDTNDYVPTEMSDEVQTVYNDTDEVYADDPVPFDDFHIDTDIYKQPGALTAILDVSSASSSACHSENESEEIASPVKSMESRDESIPEKIEMFEKLGGHKPIPRHLHHTLSNGELVTEKEDGKDVKSILKPVTNRPDNGIVFQLKEFIENKPELISLKTTEDFTDSNINSKPSGSIKKGRSISEIFAALLDDNMKDLSISAEYKNKIVRPQDLYNRIKIETDKPWDKLSRRTKERYYGAFLRKYDDALNRPESCAVDIVDIFEIVKVCVDFDDVRHKIVKYAINIVENKETFLSRQSSDDGNESDSDCSSGQSISERKSYDSITSNGFPSARSMNRASSSKSLNSIRGLRLTRDSSSSSILLPQYKIDELSEAYEDVDRSNIGENKDKSILS